MNFGLENNIIAQPFSLIFSLILFFGCYQSGNFLIEKLKLKKIFLGDKYYKYFSICFFINLILPFLHFFLLIGIGFKLFSNIIGIYVIFSFVIFLSKFKFLNLKNLKNLKKEILIIILIFLFFLSSLGPTTNADSLDYHASVAFHALNYGTYPDLKVWFHAIQAGAGEALIAFGFYFKSEQFGSLIQFSGLLCIVGIFYFLLGKYSNKKNNLDLYLFILIAITCPIFLQLVTSIKPQLFHIGAISFIFSIIFFYDEKLNNREKNLCYLILFLFLGNAFIAKYYFLLSGSILLVFFVINKIKKIDELKSFIILGIIAFFIIIFPTFIWKSTNYEIGFIDFFLNAFPTEYIGYDSLYRSIVSDGTNLSKINFKLLQIIFPISLFDFSQSLGLGILLFLLIKIKNNNDLKIVIISLTYIFLILIFGQQNARFLIEPYLWLVFLAFRSFVNSKNRLLFFYPLLIQPIIISLSLLAFIFFISIGSLSENLRKEVMIKSADGYSLGIWVNKYIKKNQVAIYNHRSISIPKFKVISTDFLLYINFNEKDNFKNSEIYFEEINKLSPDYIVFYGNDYKNKTIFNCAGNLYVNAKDVGKLGLRNIISRKKYTAYDGYIYYFDKENFPKCLNK